MAGEQHFPPTSGGGGGGGGITNVTIAEGTGATVTGDGLAMGDEANSDVWGIAFGNDAKAEYNSVAIGQGSEALSVEQVVIGGGIAAAQADYAIALKGNAGANNAISIGPSNESGQIGSNEVPEAVQSPIAIGNGVWTRGDSAIGVGSYVQSDGDKAISIGYMSEVRRAQGVAIGSEAESRQRSSIALGDESQAKADFSTAINGATPNVRERAAVGAKDLEVVRSAKAALNDDGTYGASPETGLILTDETGVRWRISVDDAGSLIVAPPGASDSLGWTRLDAAGEKSWMDACVSSDGQIIYAVEFELSSDTGKIWKSSDGGDTWAAMTVPGGDREWGHVACSDDGSKVVASTKTVGGTTPTKYRAAYSTNGGSTWTQVTTAGTGDTEDLFISADGTKMIIRLGNYLGATLSQNFYVSSNSGSTWTFREFPDESVTGSSWYPGTAEMALSADGSSVWWVGDGYVCLSEDMCATWTLVYTITLTEGIWANMDGLHCDTTGDALVLYYSAAGILFRSADRGVTWEQSPPTFEYRGIEAANPSLTEVFAIQDPSGILESMPVEIDGHWSTVNGSGILYGPRQIQFARSSDEVVGAWWTVPYVEDSGNNATGYLYKR